MALLLYSKKRPSPIALRQLTEVLIDLVLVMGGSEYSLSDVALFDMRVGECLTDRVDTGETFTVLLSRESDLVILPPAIKQCKY